LKLRKKQPDRKTKTVSFKTCPECGGTDLYYEETDTGDEVHCRECGHIASSADDEELPVEAVEPLRKDSKEVIALQCPVCGGTNLYYEAGMISGTKFHCKQCQYIGAFVLERKVRVDKDGNIKEL
jgi:DNA-directed RNA polymerase subunit M/transcription elongation factor TFIIS